MLKDGVRARISHRFENGLVETLKKDLEELGLKILVETQTTLTVAASKEQWERLGVPLKEYSYGNQRYHLPLNGAIPEALQKYENLAVSFLVPLISYGSL